MGCFQFLLLLILLPIILIGGLVALGISSAIIMPLMPFIIAAGAVIVGIMLLNRYTTKTEQRRETVSLESKKIDRLYNDGKITKEEARELKNALGVNPKVEDGDTAILKPDIHLQLMAFLHIAFPAYCLINMSSRFIDSNAISWLPSFLSNNNFLFLLIVYIIEIIAAFFIFKGERWARAVIIICSIIVIFTNYLPGLVGPIVGIYSLWVLLVRDDSDLYFQPHK